MKKNNLFCTSIYFVACLVVGLSISKMVHNNIYLNFHITMTNLIKIFGSSDPGSVASGGLAVYKMGWLDANTIWLTYFWPPGLMILEASILKLLGFNAPLVGTLQIIAALLLALTFNLIRIYIKQYFKNELVCFLIPFAVLLFSEFNTFMLSSVGVVFGETYGISLVLLGFCCLLLSCYSNRKSMALWAGLAFGLSAYFRSQFETIFVIGSINLLIIYLFFKLHQKVSGKIFFQNQESFSQDSPKKLQPIIAIFLALVVFHSITIPYRIYNYTKAETFSWVGTQNDMWKYDLLPSDYLDKSGAGFIRLGRGNISCLVDEKLCNELFNKYPNVTIPVDLARYYTILTLFHHPLTWVYLKTEILPYYWFTRADSFWDFVAPNPKPEYVENFIILGLLIITLVWPMLTINRMSSLLTFWLSNSIVLTYFIIFLFFHYEVRYFYFMKFYFLVTGTILVSDFIAHFEIALNMFKKIVKTVNDIKRPAVRELTCKKQLCKRKN